MTSKDPLGTDYFAWKQRFEREARFFCIRSKFTPNLKATCLTGKFYSKHDVILPEDADTNFVNMIAEEYAKGPKDRRLNPATENQRYGWDSEPLIPLQKHDDRLYHRRKYSPITVIASEILKSTKGLPKDPPFAGPPFKV